MNKLDTKGIQWDVTNLPVPPDITQGCKTDEEKRDAILKWRTEQNIKEATKSDGESVLMTNDGSGMLLPYIRTMEDKIVFKDEKRRQFEFHGLSVTEILFPRTDGHSTLVWSLTPFDKWILENEKRNYLFHINFLHRTQEDLDKALCAVKAKFKEHYKL